MQPPKRKKVSRHPTQKKKQRTLEEAFLPSRHRELQQRADQCRSWAIYYGTAEKIEYPPSYLQVTEHGVRAVRAPGPGLPYPIKADIADAELARFEQEHVEPLLRAHIPARPLPTIVLSYLHASVQLRDGIE